MGAKRNLNEWCRDRRVPSNSSINRRGFWARLDCLALNGSLALRLSRKAKSIDEFDSEREFGTALTLFVPAETVTMSDDTDKSSICIVPFSGKHFDWTVWREKFMTRAGCKGYKEILTGAATAPANSVTIDVTTPKGKAQKALRDANETAYEALVLLIDGETAVGRVAFNIVRECKTSKLADGDGWLAWKRLCNKYEPKSAPSRLALKSEFNNKVLKNANQDPDVWLTELEDLRMQLMNAGSKMLEDELLEHVLNNLPKEYEVVVSKLEDRLGNSVNGLTIEDVRNELN